MTQRPSIRSLLIAWEAFAEGLANGYELGLDSYLNDLDGRRLLAEAIAAAKDVPADETTRLGAADGRVLAATKPGNTCLWGSKNARRNGYDPERHWWYYAVPRRHSEQFARDLAAVK